jgi:hypothetical protein
MNIAETEAPLIIVAKICGSKEGGSNRKITYSIVDAYHNLCLDKKDIISSELEACERLLKYTIEQNEIEIAEREITELKMTLDFLP